MTARKDYIVSVRLTTAERRELAARAAQMGISLSELVRRSIVSTLRPLPVMGPQTVTLTSGAPSTTSIIWNAEEPA